MPCSGFALLGTMEVAPGMEGLSGWGNSTLPPKGTLKKFFWPSRA